MRFKFFVVAFCLLAFAAAASSASAKGYSFSLTAPVVKPDVVVKNLYAAHRGTLGPFFQTKSRARVDKYFVKDLADLIWKDAVDSKGEVGALGFDPLFNAQDTKITRFKIGKPMYGEGNLEVADVEVSFRNMGKTERLLFRLELVKNAWKISDLHYLSTTDPATENSRSLRSIYTGAAGD